MGLPKSDEPTTKIERIQVSQRKAKPTIPIFGSNTNKVLCAAITRESIAVH